MTDIITPPLVALPSVGCRHGEFFATPRHQHRSAPRLAPNASGRRASRGIGRAMNLLATLQSTTGNATDIAELPSSHHASPQVTAFFARSVSKMPPPDALLLHVRRNTPPIGRSANPLRKPPTGLSHLCWCDALTAPPPPLVNTHCDGTAMTFVDRHPPGRLRVWLLSPHVRSNPPPRHPTTPPPPGGEPNGLRTQS